MATEELVTEQFELLGIDVQKEILPKCVSLCNEYNIDAESFVEQWMAFSCLNKTPLTLKNLEILEKREFSKLAANGNNALTDDISTGTSLAIYGGTLPDNEIVSVYMGEKPQKIKVETEKVLDQANELEPTTYSPSTGHSTKFASRTNSGTVVHSFGDERLLQILAKHIGSNEVSNLNITQIPNEDGELFTKATIGFELLQEKASIFDNHIRYLSACIMKKAGISDITSVRTKSQTEVTVAGRIECDADARLNPKSVVLQGTWQESLSQTVSLDLDHLKQYSLFSGQVVVMRGINPRGDKFVAHEVFSDAALPVNSTNALKDNVSLVVAAGPYTTSDNMTYEPLKELISYIKSHKPNLVIMTGPFIDNEHCKVKDKSLASPYKSFFDKLIDSLGELHNMSPSTKIYIISNYKDAFHINVYPTLAYTTRKKHPNIQFVPDPCTLNINGVILGITSVDVLMQISQEEISLGVGGDKLSRLSSHVLSQQSYWPATEGSGSTGVSTPPIDATLWAAHAQLPRTPHILVLPSRFRYFIKEVNGTVVVNPEYLTKGTGGGTFARILLAAGEDISKSIAAQIIRI